MQKGKHLMILLCTAAVALSVTAALAAIPFSLAGAAETDGTLRVKGNKIVDPTGVRYALRAELPKPGMEAGSATICRWQSSRHSTSGKPTCEGFR